MRTALLFSLTLCCIIIGHLLAAHAQGGGTGVVKYELPATYRSGLIDVIFRYEPKFRVDVIGDQSSILLDMNVEPSVASDVKGTFSYRYLYEGQQYTDVHVGKDVFMPIKFQALYLKVVIMGNGMSHTISWNKNLGSQIVLRLPGKYKASDFTAFLQGIDQISFKGTEAIDKAIRDLRAAKTASTQNNQSTVANNATEKKVVSSSATQYNTTTSRTNTSTAKKETADDEFWGTSKKTTTTAAAASTPSSNSNTIHRPDLAKYPEFFRDPDGNYYQKDANNNVRQIDYDQMMQIKFDRSQAAKQNAAPKKLSDAEAKVEVDKIMAKIKKDQEASDQIYKNIDIRMNQYAQGFANNRAVADSRESLKEASSLSGNFQSVEQLMSEFNQKMSQVNSSVEQLRQNKNTALNHAVNMNFNTPDMAVYGESLKAIGGIINAAKAEKQRKEDQPALRAQKDTAINHMIAEEKRLLTGIRKDLFSKFPEGKVPLSSSKVAANTLYYFVYAYDPAQIGTKQPLLYVSNVFAVNRYGDGTWPFKATFTNEIQKLTPYSEVMHGYYVSEQDAESMRSGMQNIFQQSGGSVKSIVYKNKKTSSNSSSAASGDFWETGAKKEATEKKPVKKDDFWEN